MAIVKTTPAQLVNEYEKEDVKRTEPDWQVRRTPEVDVLEAILEGIDAVQSKQEEQDKVLDEIMASVQNTEDRLHELQLEKGYTDWED